MRVTEHIDKFKREFLDGVHQLKIANYLITLTAILLFFLICTISIDMICRFIKATPLGS